MKYLIAITLIFLSACSHRAPTRRIASLDEDLQRLDKNKKTVCTVTLNSDEEKNAFRARLKDFNFVELAEQTKSGDWLKSACEKKVQCDILLVSGHFGGTFFGKSGLRLPLPKLEELSCSNSCPGIFERPKEVFLMGCNTLAGKTKDRRTPEEYIRVLMEDGFTRQQAEQVAAARYSVIGSSNAQRMRMAFPGHNTKLYGFDSIGPSGKTVDEMLQRYLASVPNYSTYLDEWNPKAENTRLAAALKITSFTQAPASPKQTNNPACVLGSSDRPNSQKLAWINQVLADQAYALAYIPNIAQYFAHLTATYGDNWPAEEKAQLVAIQRNQGAKARLLKLLEKPLPGILSQQAEILNFAHTVGWVDASSYARSVKGLIGNMFQHNLTLEQKDSICAAGTHLDIALHELPTERWNEYTVQAIDCLHTKDPGVAARLIGDLQKPEVPEQLRLIALGALGSLGPLQPDVQQKLLAISESKQSDFAYSALQALAASGPTLNAAHVKLIELMKSDDNMAFSFALEGLKNSQAVSPKTQRLALNLIRDLDVPNDIYDAIGPKLISSPVVQKEFFGMLKDRDPAVRERSMWVLWSGGWKITPELKLRIAENLGDASDDVVGSAALYFMQEDQDPLSEAEEQIALKWLRAGRTGVKTEVLGMLSAKGEAPRPEAQKEIVKAMLSPNEEVRLAATYATGKFCQSNPEAVAALTAAQKDSAEYVRRAATITLKGCSAH